MKKMLGAVLAVAVVASAAAAVAGDINGTVKAVDAANRLLTLQDGTVYKFGNDMAMPNIPVGAEITLTFTTTQIPQNNVSKAVVTPKAAAK